MSKRFDANMFCGRHPFQGTARATPEQCAAKLTELGFTGAILSPMESIFLRDAFSAEQDLAGRLAPRSPFLHFQVVNPVMRWWRRWLDRGLHELDVKGVRLNGLYHQLHLAGPECAAVLDVAYARDLPVVVMCRMQDIRLQHMVPAVEPAEQDILKLLDRAKEQRLLLAGLTFHDMMRLANEINQADLLLLDTSRLKGPWRTFEKLASALDMKRLAFGSLWPVNLPECPLEQLRHAGIPQVDKDAVLGGNLARWLERSTGGNHDTDTQ